MTPIKPRIVYMGTPEFAVAPLSKLIENNFNVVGVVTVPDKPSGRGLKLNESDVKKYTLLNNLTQKGVCLMQPVSLKDEQFIKQLQLLNADIFIVVAFRMLPKVIWSMPKLGTFNLHGSLLPQYRGAAPINWAIINGEKESGVTTFLIDEQIDTGNILMQRDCTISDRETIETLYDKLMVIGANLVIETVNGLVEGTLHPHPQQGEIKGAPKLTKETGRIQWNMQNNTPYSTAILIDRLTRGLSPYPAATATISNGEKSFDFKIFEVEIAKEEKKYDGKQDYGKIVSDNKTYLHAVCGDGSILAINNIQMAGKKRMSIKEFLMGFRNIESYKFI
ncbi:MAG: methionyl-tRNA formyltransferase [Bacteroidales bacterium]